MINEESGNLVKVFFTIDHIKSSIGTVLGFVSEGFSRVLLAVNELHPPNMVELKPH